MLLVCFLWGYERFQEIPQHEPKQIICMEKPLEAAWVGLQVGSSGVSGNHQVEKTMLESLVEILI